MALGFVDLHVHLLPGVDDGPPDLDATLELAGLEVADGVDTATATPHVASVDVAEIPARVAEVNVALRKAGIPLTVEGGGELSARGVGRLSPAELEGIAHGPAGARWILLEAPLDGAVAVSFDPPVGDGGSPVTGYTVLVGDGNPSHVFVPVSGTTSPIQVPGLTNGTEYEFAVFAENMFGSGFLSATVTATPTP